MVGAAAWGASCQSWLDCPCLQVIAFGENDVYARTPLVPGSFADRTQRLTKKVGPAAALHFSQAALQEVLKARTAQRCTCCRCRPA